MQDRNPLFDRKDLANSTKPQGVGAPAKGESSSTNVPFDPEATFVDLPAAPPSDPQATMVDSGQTRGPGASSQTPAPRSSARGPVSFQMINPVLQPGDVLGGRYEIVQLLGEGGMGAVYKAMDRELDHPVALKLIRPQLAANPTMLARFKQELLLSHQVTHRNVVRIYDLGDAEGVKFITMEFVEGEDLRTLILQKKKLPPEEAVEIIQQVCRALEAAHSVGVIHRDLKPQNIMRERTGRIVVMDFGLARTVQGDGMTQTGALVGTMEYMSPEQALAQDLDQRSDLFALGLILYELLTGQTPFKAESAVASLIKRTQERAAPVSDHDGSIPRGLSNIVSKCLERDPKLRYQNAAKLLSDLEAWQGKRAGATLAFQPAVEPWARTFHWPLVAGIATVLVLAVLGYMLRGKLFSPSARTNATASANTAPAVSLAILPFRNASGDAGLDWLGPSLAEMLSTGVGQSAALRTVPPKRIAQILQDLRINTNSGSSLDDDTLRRLAGFANADITVSGQYEKIGDQMRIEMKLRDLKNDRTVPIQATAASQSQIVSAVDQLAQGIRSNLALAPETVRDLRATAFKPSTNSIPALRDYNVGLDLLRRGKNMEAEKSLEAATTDDPQFALAYSTLAQAYANLGYVDKAEQASLRAVDLSRSLPEQEKYRIVAENARISKDFPKAIEAYQKLEKIAPEDMDIKLALARLYEDSSATDKAKDYYAKLLARDPKNMDALLGAGRVEILRGDAQASIDYLNRALTTAVQLKDEEQKGAALSFLGMAYFELNQPEDALRNLEGSLEIQRAHGDKGGMAYTLDHMARAQASLGKNGDALKSWQQALSLWREVGGKHGTSITLLDMGNFAGNGGRYDEAIDLTKQSLQLQRETGDTINEAVCLNNIGWFYLQKADYDNAVTYLQQALALREKAQDAGSIAETLDNLGNTLSKTGQYDAAMKYFLRSIELWRKAGDASGLATVQYDMGNLFTYQGHYGAALKSYGDALEGFEQAKEQGPLMALAQGAYGSALASLGRDAQAEQNIKTALNRARQLKNDDVTARLLTVEGDRLFYKKDDKGAKSAYQQALSAAQRAKNPETILIAKLGLAKLMVGDGHARQASETLKQLADDAARKEMTYLSLDASTYNGEALVRSGDYRSAEDELNRVLAKTQKLNTVGLEVRTRYQLATAFHLSGQEQEASLQLAGARSLLDEIRKEAGTDDILKRPDLAMINSAAH